MPTGTLETTSKDLNPQIGMTTNDNQFLTFNLGDELYGVDILRVQEIKGYTAVTKIPNTPAHIKECSIFAARLSRLSNFARNSGCRPLTTPPSP